MYIYPGKRNWRCESVPSSARHSPHTTIFASLLSYLLSPLSHVRIIPNRVGGSCISAVEGSSVNFPLLTLSEPKKDTELIMMETGPCPLLLRQYHSNSLADRS